MFPAALKDDAAKLLQAMRERELTLATAESCTGGLIAALLTEIPGSSDVLERGFVTYSDEAKVEMLEVPEGVLKEHGAVSEQVARAMAVGALVNSEADIGVSVTGIAGPGGGSAAKPVGLVHLAVAQLGTPTLHVELRLGDLGRAAVREKSIAAALQLVRRALEAAP